jgi:hypothetical protein
VPRVFQIQFFVIIVEKNIKFKVHHQCHQCGAPVILEEETRFFVCEFCRVRSCISQISFSRYQFSPSKETNENEHIFYLPYWRFKGVRYTCTLMGVEHKFLDISYLAIENPPSNIPVSLGFRSQSLALNFVKEKTKTTFLKPKGYKRSLFNMGKRARSNDKIVIQENIGETTSLIYSPFFFKNDKLFDGILNKSIGPVDPRQFDIQTYESCRPEKEIFFVPGICPSCGWDLGGHSDSLVLICSNCETLWRSHKKKLAKIKFGCVNPVSNTDVMLPFWKINADISKIDLKSNTDLIKLTNLHRVEKKGSGKSLISFWAPAFKIRPKIFLKLTTQLTIIQPEDTLNQHFKKKILYPVNLPSTEAVESIKITLAALMKPARQYLPLLSESTITPTAIKLLYLPFESKSHELFHPQLGVSINKNSLKLSGNL